MVVNAFAFNGGRPRPAVTSMNGNRAYFNSDTNARWFVPSISMNFKLADRIRHLTDNEGIE